MSSCSPAPQGQVTESYYQRNISPFVGPFLGSTGIIPFFWLLERKTALQKGEPVPRYTVNQALNAGCKATPLVSFLFGVQIGAQNAVESLLKKRLQDSGLSDTAYMLLSSSIVGFISAPCLAALQGKMSNIPVMTAVRKLTVFQVSMIVTRETSFLLSMRISEPLNDVLVQQYGQSRKVKYSSAFISGAIGSVVGHMADTAFACNQNNIKISGFMQLWRGGATKALAIGGFNVAYTAINDVVKIVNHYISEAR